MMPISSAMAKGLVLVVRHHDCGRPLALEDFPHFDRKPLTQADIEVGERLVEEDQLGARRQRAGQRDALLLAAGEFMRVFVALAMQTDRGQQLADAQVGIFLGVAAEPEGDVLFHREMRKQA